VSAPGNDSTDITWSNEADFRDDYNDYEDTNAIETLFTSTKTAAFDAAVFYALAENPGFSRG
jgi:hypothetical protein